METESEFSGRILDSIPPSFGLEASSIDSSRSSLEILLGIEYTLALKTQNFHWNVIGPNFGSLHELFGKQYTQLNLFIDRVAEQIRKYGVAAPASFREFISLNGEEGIEQDRGVLINQTLAIGKLHESNQYVVNYINSLDSSTFDLATQNLLGEILDFHMKNVWMLKAHLE